MSKRSFIACRTLFVMAVAASVGILGIAPVHAAVSFDVVAPTVPAAPLIMPATAGNGEATASWSAPANDGGSPVVTYHVLMVDAATGTTVIATQDVVAPASSLRFTGLQGGVSIRFHVQAVNAVGTGLVSDLSNVVVPVTRPNVPKIGTATAGAGSALGRWTAPSNGGAAIGRYHVRLVDAATGKRAFVVRDVAGSVTSLNITGLAKGTAVRFQVQAVNALGASALSAFSNAVTVRAPVVPGYHTGTQTIGRSVQGRAITLAIVGSPTAKKRVMVIGEIHGNERGGVPIATAIAKSRAPGGVAYFVIAYPNPDGAARNTRGNARRVDLNRNYPGWKRNGGPGYVYYPGTGALSEPESKAVFGAINKIKPTAFVTYHQHMNLISFVGGSRAAGKTYARQSGMRIDDGTLPAYRGSQATWLHATYPHTFVMTVELPARVPAVMVKRHIAALKYLATHH